MEQYCGAVDEKMPLEAAKKLNEYSVLQAIFGDSRYTCVSLVVHMIITDTYVCIKTLKTYINKQGNTTNLSHSFFLKKERRAAQVELELMSYRINDVLLARQMLYH